MQPFRDRPIRQKLAITTLIATAVALLIAGTGIVLADWVLFRGYLRRDLTALTRIVADNSTAALAFNDPDAATQTLGALRARPHLAAACIYRNDGSVLADYLRDRAESCPTFAAEETFRFGPNAVTVSEPIMLRGQRTGTLTILYELGEIAERIKLYSAMVFAVSIVASLLALLLSSRWREGIATPISGLVRASTSVSQTGDYSIRAQKLSRDELGLLVDRFNEMLEGIQSREEQLKAALLDREAALHDAESERQRFEFLAESLPEKIFTANPAGSTDYLNRQWTEYTGLPAEGLLGAGWTKFIHPDDVEETTRLWRQSVETGQPFLLEHRFRSAAGKYSWHLTRIHAMRDAKGRISMWVGSSTDIDAQKEKEQALRRANDDLQQFAYSASHDLQEPIRNVAVYSEIVARRYESKLDAEGRLFLDFLREGGRRLATLVNDLLAYTRASMVELNVVTVDSQQVLEASLASLAEAVRESQANITSDPLPQILMGEAHLQQVFQNLIGNALKYRDAEPPQIHVSASEQASMWCFSVRDNGIGIAPQYKEKIFGVFKRLHHDQKYAGTGIGLAICHRIVERYGGRIWVESQPGEGSTFFFTIPRTSPGGASKAQDTAG